jgi:hypothetical protein
MPDESEIVWNDDLEKYLCSYAEKASVLRILHMRQAQQCSAIDMCIMVPAISLQLICATIQQDPSPSRVVVATTSTTSAILCALSKYLRMPEQHARHKGAAQKFGKLYRYITSQMAIPRNQRAPCRHMLAMTSEKFDQAYETGPGIPQWSISIWKLTHHPAISMPDICNGLEPVKPVNENCNDWEPVKPVNENVLVWV